MMMFPAVDGGPQGGGGPAVAMDCGRGGGTPPAAGCGESSVDNGGSEGVMRSGRGG